MSNASATSAAAPAKSGPGVRTMLLAGCSVGGTLCASLSSTSEVNLPFVIGSAVFAGLIVLVTAAPQAVPTASAAPAAGAAAPTPAIPQAGGSVSVGISAGVVSFILAQLIQFAIGFGVAANITGELSIEDFFLIMTGFGLTILMIKFPFDLMLGAYLLSRARNVLKAVGVALATYLVCYAVEQTWSASMGMSGFALTLQSEGILGIAAGLAFLLGLPAVALSVGGFGAKLAGRLTRPRVKG